MANALALPLSVYYKKSMVLQYVDSRERLAGRCLRVAASSNKPFSADRKKPRLLKSTLALKGKGSI